MRRRCPIGSPAAALAALTLLRPRALGAARCDAPVEPVRGRRHGRSRRSRPGAARRPRPRRRWPGIVALGAIAVWPGLQAPPEPRLLAPAVAGCAAPARQRRELPDVCRRHHARVAAVAALRLWRGRALPVRHGRPLCARRHRDAAAGARARLPARDAVRPLHLVLRCSPSSSPPLFYLAADRFHNVRSRQPRPPPRSLPPAPSPPASPPP